MSLVIIAPGRDRSVWVEAIHAIDPRIPVDIYPDVSDKKLITGALVWHYPHGSLNEFPNLKWVSSIGAGVDYILNDPDLPDNISITRIVDKNLSLDMKRTAALAVLSWENRLKEYLEENRWEKRPQRALKTIGILGLGEMGRSIGTAFYELGYLVKGFSKTKKEISGINSYHGKITEGFLMDLDVLINVLPLTDETTDILNYELFTKIKPGAYLVNLGRGLQLVEEDLIRAIDDKIIAGAWLDVFREEPLPKAHPFWSMPEITVMPHVASITNPESAAEVVVENYRRMESGTPLLYLVDRDEGY